MDERMIEAAHMGNINFLYELILNDPYVLQRIDDVPFFNTQLQVATSVGHIEFMMEMIKLKPTFARKLNQAGFSPMHLALQNHRTHAVLRLLRFDEGLVCPEAIEDMTVRDEMVFHLAVENDTFEAFQVLVGWLMRSCHESAQWEKELLSWADIDDNTVLHIAAIRNRAGVVKVLLEHMRRDQINAKNLEGLTALDIQSQYPWNERQADRIIDMLSKAGGLSASSSSFPNTSISSFHIESLKKKMSRSQKWGQEQVQKRRVCHMRSVTHF
ncbi:hypothetical protein GOBAR_DD24186 [Gossypium barbadense]|nr:hypothetical protein GOBAR_DD24186 [Gossypium barbadense]